jgi:hypothetical protein
MVVRCAAIASRALHSLVARSGEPATLRRDSFRLSEEAGGDPIGREQNNVRTCRAMPLLFTHPSCVAELGFWSVYAPAESRLVSQAVG